MNQTVYIILGILIKSFNIINISLYATSNAPNNAFMQAVFLNDSVGIELSINAGASVNTRYEHTGETALMIAIYLGHHQAVHMLLAHKAEVNLKADDGRTALMHAVTTARSKQYVIPVLLYARADINAHDEYGETALNLAVKQGSYDVTALLLEHGAFSDFKDCRGWTALTYAVDADNVAMVGLLLMYASYVGLQESLRVARSKKNPIIIALVADKIICILRNLMTYFSRPDASDIEKERAQKLNDFLKG